MKHVGMFEAKTHFSELVERVVAEGRPITITRRGQPIVDITPTQARQSGQLSRKDAVEQLFTLRKEVASNSDAEILALIEEGRSR